MKYQLQAQEKKGEEMDSSERRVVLVTGGTKGLGLAIVKSLSKQPSFVIVAAARKESLEITKLVNEADNVFFEELDLSESASLHQWAKNFFSKYGAPYGLINNAAIAHDGVLATMHESQIEETISVNVIGNITLTKYMSRKMLTKRSGRIVNISSIIASTGFNGLSVYAASKAALNGFTKSLASELGRVGITVNSVAPGYMETEMSSGLIDEQLAQIKRRSALRRLATTEEVASIVRYLMTDEAAAVTGTIFTVDAGNTA